MKKFRVVMGLIVIFFALALPLSASAQTPPCPTGMVSWQIPANMTVNGMYFPQATTVCVTTTTSTSLTVLTIKEVSFPITADGNIFLSADAINNLKNGERATLVTAEPVVVNWCGPDGCHNGQILVDAGNTCIINATAGDSSGIRVANEHAVRAATAELWYSDGLALVNAAPRVYTSRYPSSMTCTATTSGG